MKVRDVIKYFWFVPIPFLGMMYFIFDGVRPERPGGDIVPLACFGVFVYALVKGQARYKKSKHVDDQ